MIANYNRITLYLITVFCCSFTISSHVYYDKKFKTSSYNVQHYNIGLVIMATGRYLSYAEALIDSAEKFFLVNHKKSYFIFTDSNPNTEKIVTLPSKNKKIYIFQKRLGWPYDTMMRPVIYFNNFKLFNCNFIFAIDADMKFIAPVGDEILSDRVAVLHPGYPPGTRGTYETRQSSSAYIADHEGSYYFAGGFHGGRRNEFYKLCKDITQNINLDLSKNIIAIWHDESHLNKWFLVNPPTLILDPSYCYPENAMTTFNPSLRNYLKKIKPKLFALDKNHQELRAP